MPAIETDKMDEIRRRWIDSLVIARSERPELERFAGKTGRVVTVNYNGKAIVDFGDGAWYDIPASDDFITVIPPGDPRRDTYNAEANSAQPFPERKG